MALEKAVRTGNSTGFKFTSKGDSLKGYYLGTTVEQINGKDVDVHRFQTSDGVFSVLGQADIKQQIKTNSISKGTWVEITFSGEMQKLKGGRTLKLYEVAFDRDDTLDSAALEVEEHADDESEEELQAAPPKPVAPKTAAVPPSADRQARLQAMLNRGKSA